MKPNKHTHGKMTKRLYLPKTIDKINIKYYERNLLKKIANEPMYFKLFFSCGYGKHKIGGFVYFKHYWA